MFTKKSLPRIIGYVDTPLKPLDLNDYFYNASKKLTFEAKLIDDSPLPHNIVCHKNGIIEGTPAPGTNLIHYYHVIVTVTNKEGQKTSSPLIIEIELMKPREENEVFESHLLPRLNPLHKQTSSVSEEKRQEREAEKSKKQLENSMTSTLSTQQDEQSKLKKKKQPSLFDTIQKALEDYHDDEDDDNT